MKANSLGFSTEIVSLPKVPVAYCEDVEATTTTVVPGRRLMSRTACLCCTFTTILVASAVGVGIWFVATEM